MARQWPGDLDLTCADLAALNRRNLNRLSDGSDASQDEVDAGEELLAVVVLG
jgi:hypothetical protein